MKYFSLVFFIFVSKTLLSQYQINNYSLSNGGGEQSNSQYYLHYDIGQTVIDESQNSNYLLQSGYIYALENGVELANEPHSHSNLFKVDSIISSNSIIFEVQPASQLGASGYIILAKEQSPPTIYLTDGSAYQLHSTQNNSKIVTISFDKDTTLITATGLSPNKSYTFSLIPFNWDGNNNLSINYKTDGQIPMVIQATPIPTMTEWALIVLGLSIPIIVYFKMKT